MPLRHDDPFLLRFLRARKFDIPKAKAMIIDQEKWRKEFRVDDLDKGAITLLSRLNYPTPSFRGFDFPERAEVDKHYPQFYHKTDRVCSSLP